MPRFFAFSFVLLVTSVLVYGQSTTRVDYDLVFNKTKYPQKNISLVPKVDKKLEFPFLEKIEVVDARSDSSCIGFRTRSTEKNNQMLQFSNGLKAEFESFFRKIIKFSPDTNATTAILVVRNYWINEFDVDDNDNDKFTEDRSGKYAARKTALRATFDFYFAKNDAYFVAYRFDTLASAFLNIKEFSETYLENILQNSISRLQLIDPATHVVNKRKFTREELQAYYRARWDKPILKDTELVRGVYKNFPEFLNNRPSIERFVVRKDKLADVLYVPLKNEEMTVARDVWGYCDGKKIFIKSGENYYLLVRVQNGFYFLGSKELMKSQDDSYLYDPTMPMNMRVTSETYLKNRLFPLKLDMEKGVVY